MSSGNNDDIKNMQRDNWLSVLTGPLKIVIPSLSYIILYPLMISKTNIEVVGVWSLLATIVTFISITDVGFSQLLTREAGPDRSDVMNEVYADYITARRSYILLLLILILVFLATSSIILAPLASVYSIEAMKVSVVLILIGAIIQLIGKLDAAILSARHDNYIVQVVSGIVPLLTYSTMIAGTLIEKPIEGLAVGTILTGIATVIVYRLRLRRHHKEFVETGNSPGLVSSGIRFISLVRRGRHLYSSSMGMMLRGPIYRVVIVSTIGLQAAAVFDIAMRVSQTVRQVIATGFSVLYPSLSFLYRSEDRDRIIKLIRISLMVLLTMGTFVLGMLIAAVAPILSLWLGDYPPDLIPSIKVLAIWHLITLANVPYWYLLQASHNERVAAYSIWAHTALLILAMPASSFFNIGIVDLLVYWTVTSVFTQGLIYHHVQKKLALLWEPIKSSRMIALALLIVTYTTTSYVLSSSISDFEELAKNFSLIIVIYLFIAAVILFKPVSDFFGPFGSRANRDNP